MFKFNPKFYFNNLFQPALGGLTICKDNNLYKLSQDKTGALVGRKYEASCLVLYFARPGGESQVLPRPQGRWRGGGGREESRLV